MCGGQVLTRKLEQWLAKAFVNCQAVKSAPAKAPLHPWIWPDKPGGLLHVDFAGPFQGRMFLLIVDVHSKWPEVQEIGSRQEN